MPTAAETKKVIDVIKKMLTELAKLSDEDLEKVVSGELKFQLNTPGKTTRSGGGSGSPKKGKIDFSEPEVLEKAKNEFQACGSRLEAMQYLNDLKLTKDQVKAVADSLNCRIPGNKNRDDMIKALVDGTVGARLDKDAVDRT